MSDSAPVFLIDLDGTLLKTNNLVFTLANALLLMRRFFPRFGIKTYSIIKNSIERMMENQPQSGKTNFQVLQEEMARRSQLLPEEFQQQMWDFYQNDFPKLKFLCRPMTGARVTLEQWKKEGAQLFLTTNPIWPERAVKLRLQWAGIPDTLFSGVTHSENWNCCKPNKAYYKEVLNRWHLSPARCVMIGDSVIKDGPAQEVGIKVKIIPKKHKSKFWKSVDFAS